MHTRIRADAIDIGELLEQVRSPEDGAVLLFLGTVRDHNDARSVLGMRYEAYVDMAGPVLAEIAAEAAARLGTDHIAVEHRVGQLAVGEISVAIAVSSPHRAEAYDASRTVIEEIKKRLPVWKEEHYADGESRWLDGVKPPAPEAAHE